MFVESLSNKIKLWKSDPSPFIKMPHRGHTVSKGEAYEIITSLTSFIRSHQIDKRKLIVGFCFKDPANWIYSIISIHLSEMLSVPIPIEFSNHQIASFAPHLDLLLVDSQDVIERFDSIFKLNADWDSDEFTDSSQIKFFRNRNKNSKISLPSTAVSVIHTSGSTSSPKGVVLSSIGMLNVINSMSDRVKDLETIHYASVLPMSLLLEQILGIFLPIFTNGSVSVLPNFTASYTGTQSELDEYIFNIRESSANFTMVPPSFLDDMIKNYRSSTLRTLIGHNLKILATGGAPIQKETIRNFSEANLEVFQGYGLSENTSVVSWTYPGPNEIGSVGKPLAHCKVKINEEGQIEVSGESLFLGYVQSGRFKSQNSEWFNTGDNGYFDSNGNLYVTGRDANLLVLSSGRNVSPEWIEGIFKTIGNIKDFILLGHGKPFLSALVLIDREKCFEEVIKEVKQFSEEVSEEFPEFSRIREFRAVKFENEYYSVSGRILRNRVVEMNKSKINEIYLSATDNERTI